MKIFFSKIILLILSFSLPVLSTAQFLGGNADGGTDASIINVACGYSGMNLFRGGNGDGHSDAVFVNTVCSQSGLNPFSGGNSDGHSDDVLLRTACSAAGLNPFTGGNNDGHSDVSIINSVCASVGVNPFSGGNNDGHSDVVVLSSVCASIGVNPFTGGDNDGHSDVAILTAACAPVGVNPFTGGNNDGHSDIHVTNTVCVPTGVNPFAGGISDGHSNVDLINTACVVALPVDLLYFDAACKTNSVILDWATASENKNDYFILERSGDNIRFGEIAKIKGKGQSSSVKAYSYLDLNPAEGQAYYRLVQVDYDGKTEYLHTIASNCSVPNLSSMLISPNPNNGNFTIRGFGESAEILVYNTVGEIVLQTRMNPEAKEIVLTEFSSGVYYVVASTATRTYSSKMVVTK